MTPPFLVEFVQDHHVLRRLYDPAGSEIVKNNAWKSLRIAPGHRIIRQCRRHLRHSERRLMGHEGLPSQSREGYLVLGLPVRWHGPRPRALQPATGPPP